MGENQGRYKVDPRDFTDAADEPRPREDAAPFRALLLRALTLTGGIGPLARRLEVTTSHVSRLNKGLVGASIEVLLYLAEVIDEDPVSVLRSCGHARMADRLRVLLKGVPQRPRHALYDAIDQLSDRDRDVVTILVARLLNTTESTPPAPDPAGGGR